MAPRGGGRGGNTSRGGARGGGRGGGGGGGNGGGGGGDGRRTDRGGGSDGRRTDRGGGGDGRRTDRGGRGGGGGTRGGGGGGRGQGRRYDNTDDRQEERQIPIMRPTAGVPPPQQQPAAAPGMGWTRRNRFDGDRAPRPQPDARAVEAGGNRGPRWQQQDAVQQFADAGGARGGRGGRGRDRGRGAQNDRSGGERGRGGRDGQRQHHQRDTRDGQQPTRGGRGGRGGPGRGRGGDRNDRATTERPTNDRRSNRNRDQPQRAEGDQQQRRRQPRGRGNEGAPAAADADRNDGRRTRRPRRGSRAGDGPKDLPPIPAPKPRRDAAADGDAAAVPGTRDAYKQRRDEQKRRRRNRRKKDEPAPANRTSAPAAAGAREDDAKPSRRRRNRRSRNDGKQESKDGKAPKSKHADPFADPVGAHTHTEVSPPANIHGHKLLEGDVQDDIRVEDMPPAFRDSEGGSSSAFEETDEETDSDRSDKTDEDFSDTANERPKEYRAGGYHPVYVGEVYNSRYRVVHKLGWGYFSTVWLVWDHKNESFHAMKVQKSAQHYRDAAYDEIKLLTQIMGADPSREHCCARMTDSFEHVGPHGTHVVMIFDVLGENLLKLMERYEYKGIPIPIVKAIAKQTLIGLRHIHSLDIIHTDLKPENVLLSNPKHSIHSILKHYKAPALSENLSLLERDRSMMTKSQKRRYDAKVRKLRREQAERDREAKFQAEGSGSDDEEGDAEDDGSDSRGSGTGDTADAPGTVDHRVAVEGRRAADGFGLNTDELHPEVSAGVRAAEAAVNADASDTDPEWEVQRFQSVCLADFGNSCWTYKQFADEVQTRQYRCPEVIIGDPYGTAIDLWSAACMFFELLTGEFLFDPKDSSEYPRDEDHLALVMELLGPLPPHMALGRGKFREQYFNSRGELRHIRELKYWGLKDVLHKKYRFSRKKAREITEFLMPMLVLDPRERATAAEMLDHFDDFFEAMEDDFAPACFSTGESDDEDDEDELPRPFTYGGARHADPGGMMDDDDEEEEEEDVGTWLANHPLLHEAQLAAMGVALNDVMTVLQGGVLADKRKQQVVNVIIDHLQAEVDEADGNFDDEFDDDDEEEEFDDDDDDEDEEDEEQEFDEDDAEDDDVLDDEEAAKVEEAVGQNGGEAAKDGADAEKDTAKDAVETSSAPANAPDA